MADRFDFAKAVKELLETDLQYGKGQIHIWGGRIEKNETESLEQVVQRFLGAWPLSSQQMPWWILEYADSIKMEKDKSLDDIRWALLERARVFGPDGDLSLRRDGDVFLWHFISTVFAPPAQTQQQGKDFWIESSDTAANPSLNLRRQTERALLWGKHRRTEGEQNYWHDDRVGRFELQYPHEAAERLEVEYDVFTDGGQVSFVWWKELRAHG